MADCAGGNYGVWVNGLLQGQKDEEIESKEKPIEKYMALRKLEKKNPKAFHRLLQIRTKALLPIVYTPTVGEACQNYHKLGIQTNGLYLKATDKGKFLEKLRAWPRQKVKVIVITDGERILGLGDLGAGGIGISEGKILLYTAIGGIDPECLLPVCLDVGTNRENLLNDPDYKGLRQHRVTGDEYYSLVDEFMKAVKEWQDYCFVQFEDFGNHNAFVILDKYRDSFPCFNDDIQGTATIVVAALLAATRSNGSDLGKQTFLFFGAGEAATGIARLIVMGLQKWFGLSIKEARKRCILFDSQGIVHAGRKSQRKLKPHKVEFAHKFEWDEKQAPRSLIEAVKIIKPTALIGSATMPGAFDEAVVKEMTKNNAKPIIFALSNPTSKSECTFQDAYKWSGGRVVFASGSPFPPISEGSLTITPAQANNAYVFPAIGHAAVLTKAKCIPDDLLLGVAKYLGEYASEEELKTGKLLPPFKKIHEVSATSIAALCKQIVELDLHSAKALQKLAPRDFQEYVMKRHQFFMNKPVQSNL